MRTCRSCSLIRRPMRSLTCIASSHMNIHMISSSNNIICLCFDRATLADEVASRQGRFGLLRQLNVTILEHSRRHVLHLLTGAGALMSLPGIASAAAYPSRPVRTIVGFPAGGPRDVVARLISQWLSEGLGHQFVVENRVGAGGTIGAELVV